MKNIKPVDNRGFVVVETIIVAVFVLGICTFLFLNLLPLIGDYERISKYDDLSSKYKTHEIRKMLVREGLVHEKVKKVFTDYISDDSSYHIYSYETKTNGEVSANMYDLCWKLDGNDETYNMYCHTLLGERFLDVKEIMVTPFKLTNVKTKVKKDNRVSRELKEYIDYLPSYKKYSSDYDSYYRLIVVFNNGNIANVEVDINVYEEPI